MSWILDHWLVVFFLLLYAGLLVHHALAGKRRTRGMADYIVGGRSIGGITVGLSFFATYSSTNSFVGFSGQAYSYGVAWLLIGPAAMVFALVAWTCIAPRLRDFTASLDSVTIPDFIGFRFESAPARIMAAFIVLFASFLYMTAIFKGLGNLVEAFLEVPYKTAIVIVFFIVVTYTVIGGFHSVVRTDAVLAIVMLLAATLLFTGAVRASGGLMSFAAVKDLPEGAALFSWNVAMPFGVLLGIIVAGTFKLVVEPRQLSRFYALPDQRAVRRGTIVSTLAFFIVYSLLVPIGIYARNIIPSGVADTDTIVPTLLTGGAVYNPVASAFLLVALMAAAMTSLDSVLLVMASTCQRDIVGLLRRQMATHNAVLHTRGYVALFALITALIALNPPGGIVTLTAFSGSLYAACFFPAIALGLHWRRGNGKAVITSFVVGLAILALWPSGSRIHAMFPAVALSMLSYVAIALYARPVASPEVERLFAARAPAAD
jgi:SSS family transporter